MHGVTTALVAFLFVCVVFPNLIKNRAQYYAAFAIVCLVILLDALGVVVGASGALRAVCYFFTALLQICAMLVLFLAAGGITWRALAGDMRDAFEVIRRGGEEKEVIIPLSGEMARRAAARREQADDDAAPRIVIDDDTAPPAGAPASQRAPEGGSIPLEP
jgi:hypothetical protein